MPMWSRGSPLVSALTSVSSGESKFGIIIYSLAKTKSGPPDCTKKKEDFFFLDQELKN